MNIETCLQMFILKSNVYKHVYKIVYVAQWCSTSAQMDVQLNLAAECFISLLLLSFTHYE